MSDQFEEPRDEVIGTPKVKKRGRPKNDNYLPWEDARELVRNEMIPSRGKYHSWWDANKPKAIPRFPYRVYTEEWTSWNDFLGTNNKFNEKIGTKWKPLLEATLFVHSLKLKTAEEWMTWCKGEGNLPVDIPARPDLVYEDWRTWNHWLGNKPAEVVQVRQEAQKVQVLSITHEEGSPQNVLLFTVEPSLGAVKERWQRSNGSLSIVKLFWFEQEKAPVIKEITEALSSSYQGFERERIVPNVWEIVYHLQMHLNQVTRAEANR